jgi:hypothetical protein
MEQRKEALTDANARLIMLLLHDVAALLVQNI